MIEQLQRGIERSYGNADGGAAAGIKQHETHISWVILCGDWAFKFKKPIRNPFLDYRTLEDRYQACRDELVLNRRYAPELYEAVIAVVGGAGPDDIPRVQTVCTTGAASALPAGTIDVAVKMRRFPEDALLSEHLRAGDVTDASMAAFAKHVAQFHLDADVAPGDSSWGTAATMAGDQHDNVRYLRETSQLPAEVRADLEVVAEWLEGASETLAGVMETRRKQGFVRACHGDLHAENIVRWRDAWIPFDGIEFNEHLRWIDVQCDVAFTTMDLRSRGREHLAHGFANAYLEATGDYGGLRVARYFEVYRAMVRAKVAAIRAEQLAGDAGDTHSAEASRSAVEDVVSHVRLARRLLEQRQRCLCITHGLSGSGKTYGSEAYLAQHGMRRVRSDVERKRMFAGTRGNLASPAYPGGDVRVDDLYGAEASRRTYQRLYEVAELALEAEVPCLVDATFLRAADRDRFAELAQRMGAEFRILAFTAAPEVLRERIRQRQASGQDASDADLEVLAMQEASLESLSEAEQERVVAM